MRGEMRQGSAAELMFTEIPAGEGAQRNDNGTI